MAGEIRTKIVVDGARESQAAIRGLRKEVADAEASANKGRDSRGKFVKQAADAEKAAADTTKAAVEQVEKAKRDASAKTTRETEQNIRKQVESEKAGARSRLQTIQQFATAAISLYQSVSQRASALSGAFGGRSREALLSDNMSNQMQMARLARDTGIRRSELQSGVVSAARASGIDPSQIIAGLAQAGDVGGDAAAAAILRNASTVGRHAMAVGADFGTVASPLAQALRSGMDESQIGTFLNQYTGLVTSQNVSPEALSGRLGAAFSSFGTATGQTGGAAVLGAMRLQGTLGAAFGGGERQIGGQYDRLMGMLQDQGFQRRLQGVAGTTGTQGNHVGGVLADPMQTLQAMANSGRLATGQQFARLAGSTENGQALATLINAMRRGGGAMADVLGASGAAGAAYTSGVMADMQGVAGFGNAANQSANFMEHGQDFAHYADAMADGIDTLNSKFPMAVEGLDNLGGAIERVTQALGFAGMAAGGAAAVGGGAGTAASLGGVGAAGAGAGALTAGVGAGVVGGALVLAEGARRVERNAAQEDQFYAMGGEAGRARRAVAAANAPASLGFFGTPGAVPVTSQGGNARPATVALDRGSVDTLATAIGARVSGDSRRGPPERR